MCSYPPFSICEGSVTAANSSSLNDGARYVIFLTSFCLLLSHALNFSAIILMSAAKAKALGVKPLARIRGRMRCQQLMWLYLIPNRNRFR